MKKLLSLFMVCCCVFGAMASEVVFDASVTTSGNTTAGAQTVTLNGVTLSVSNGILGSTSNDYRIYKNHTLTISASSAITNVEFICTASGEEKYGPGCFTVADGTYTFEGTHGYWTGSSNSIVFTASTNQVRATKIIVTLNDGSLSAPTFSPAAGTFYEPTNVTINAQDGSTIYYTLDGTDPTTSSNVYSEAIPVSVTTTIKAIAVLDDMTSPVATAVYTIAEAQVVENIAAYAALADNTTAKIGNPVTVTYSNGSSTYVKDATGYMCIYGSEIEGMYSNGDVIPAGFGGVKTIYNTGLEMQYPLIGFTEPTATAEANAEEVTVASFPQAKMWQYVVVKGATIDYLSGKYIGLRVDNSTDSIAVYNQFSIPVPDQSSTYDVYGIVTSYNGNLQLYVTEFIDTNPTYVDNIAALLALESGKNATITGNVTAIHHSGKQLYIMDETGFMLVYGSLSNTYNNGDVLSNITGSWEERYGMTEIIPVASSFGEATAGTPVEPVLIPIEEIDQSLVHNYLKIEGCSVDSIAGSKGRNFNINDGTADLTMRLNFSEVTIGEDFDYDATYNITGFLAIYDNGTTSTIQFYPSAIEKVGGQQVVGDVNQDGAVNASDVTALYNYILNGDETFLTTSDVNNDGSVNASDVTAVYNIILGSN